MFKKVLSKLTNDELSASSRDEFVSASKIQRAPHSLMNANCEPEKGKDKDKDKILLNFVATDV